MRAYIISMIIGIMPLIANAGFEEWTNKEGKSVKLKLVSSKEIGGVKVGTFQMISGTRVDISEDQLSDKDAQRLRSWTPFTTTGPDSFFDEDLTRNLEEFKNGKLIPMTRFDRPSKYYVFYYTASRCPHCRKFTPELVQWYNKNKNNNFELILISSDGSREKMQQFASKFKVTWPLLKHQQVRPFKTKHDFGVRGIPTLIVCDIDGKNLGNYRGKLSQLSKLIK